MTVVKEKIAEIICSNSRSTRLEKCENENDDGVLGSLTMVYEMLCLKPDVMKDYDVSNTAKRGLDECCNSSDQNSKRKRET